MKHQRCDMKGFQPFKSYKTMGSNEQKMYRQLLLSFLEIVVCLFPVLSSLVVLVLVSAAASPIRSASILFQGRLFCERIDEEEASSTTPNECLSPFFVLTPRTRVPAPLMPTSEKNPSRELLILGSKEKQEDVRFGNCVEWRLLMRDLLQ